MACTTAPRFSEGRHRQIRISRAVALGGKHQRSERHLRRANQHDPMLQLMDQRRRIAEFVNRWVHLAAALLAFAKLQP
jgi:hypothetical protein